MHSICYQICIAAIKRTTSHQEFSTEDYELCLIRESQIGTWSLPVYPLTSNWEPSEVVRDYLAQMTGLESGLVFSLDVCSEMRETTHYVTICYVAVIPQDAIAQNRPSVEVKFESLLSVCDTCQDGALFNQSQTQIVQSAVSWLRDQHTDGLIRLDKIFEGGSEGFSKPISVRALLGNPLYESQLSPPEDKLLVALDNPVFQFLISGQETFSHV